MKYVLVFLVVGVAWWWLRAGRPRAPSGQTKPAPPAASPTQAQLMLRCLHCQLHMPPSTAWHGQRGAYCSPAHCDAAGDAADT